MLRFTVFLIAISVFGAMTLSSKKPSGTAFVRVKQTNEQIAPTVAAPVTTATITSRWDVSEEISKIDDSKNVFAFGNSDEPALDRFGKPHRVTANAVCRENKTHFYIVFDDIFMADSGAYGVVTTRLDTDKARRIEMNESTDHGALGLWNGQGVAFLKSMLGKKSLFIRATPFSESPIDLSFDLSGFDKSLAKVRAACHW